MSARAAATADTLTGWRASRRRPRRSACSSASSCSSDKHEKYRCACAGCVEAARTRKALPGGRYSVDFAVSIAIAKYTDHLPLERQVRIMKRQGLAATRKRCATSSMLSLGTCSPRTRRCGAMLAQPCIGANETFWRLMEATAKTSAGRSGPSSHPAPSAIVSSIVALPRRPPTSWATTRARCSAMATAPTGP